MVVSPITTDFFTSRSQELVDNGQYPVFFAKDGKFEFKLLSVEDFDNYEFFDALDSDIESLISEHGYGLPVWDGQHYGDVQHKEPTGDEETE